MSGFFNKKKKEKQKAQSVFKSNIIIHTLKKPFISSLNQNISKEFDN